MSINKFQIKGGNKLSGSIVPQGAKNEALQVLCAVLLTNEEVIIRNIPSIRDVNTMIDIIADMGVTVEHLDKHTCRFKADKSNPNICSRGSLPKRQPRYAAR